MRVVPASSSPIRPGTRCQFQKGRDQNLERNANWKGDAASKGAARDRLKRRLPVEGPCEAGCGAPARDRHHKDGNPHNNDRANIALLCRRCHMVADGRIEKVRGMDAWRTARKVTEGGAL